LIIFPLIGWIGNKGLGFGLTFIAMLLQGIYLGWALNGFLQLKTFLQRFKSMSVAILTIFLWAIVSVMILMGNCFCDVRCILHLPEQPFPRFFYTHACRCL